MMKNAVTDITMHPTITSTRDFLYSCGDSFFDDGGLQIKLHHGAMEVPTCRSAW